MESFDQHPSDLVSTTFFMVKISIYALIYDHISNRRQTSRVIFRNQALRLHGSRMLQIRDARTQ